MIINCRFNVFYNILKREIIIIIVIVEFVFFAYFSSVRILPSFKEVKSQPLNLNKIARYDFHEPSALNLIKNQN